MTLLWSFTAIQKAGEILIRPKLMFSAEIKQGDILPSCFSTPPLNNGLFMFYLVPRFSHLCILLAILRGPQAQSWSAI